MTNSDKRGSTHSIADIEAKRCKNVLEITPKVALKQGFKVAPSLYWQARLKLTKRRPSNLAWQTIRNKMICIWRIFCVIFGLISAQIVGAGAHLRGCGSRRFASPPRTSLILAEKPPVFRRTHICAAVRPGSASCIIIGPGRLQSPRQTNENEDSSI